MNKTELLKKLQLRNKKKALTKAIQNVKINIENKKGEMKNEN